MFTLDRQPTSLDNDKSHLATIRVSLSPALKSVERSGYTILDLLSDVGGISGLLFSGAALLLSILNHNYFDNYMVSKLYKLRTSQRNTVEDSYLVKPSRWSGTADFCISVFRSCCTKGSSRSYRHRQALQNARKQFEQETDIVNIIQSRRLLKNALNLLLPKAEIKELEQSSLFTLVSYSQDEEGLRNEKRGVLSMSESRTRVHNNDHDIFDTS